MVIKQCSFSLLGFLIKLSSRYNYWSNSKFTRNVDKRNMGCWILKSQFQCDTGFWSCNLVFIIDKGVVGLWLDRWLSADMCTLGLMIFLFNDSKSVEEVP